MVNHIVSCEQVWREISNYVDGEVDAGLRSLMEEHFRTCQRCAAVLAGTRNVVALYGDERMLEVPAGFGRRLEKRLATNAAVKGSGWSRWSAWLVPVAALALIVGTLLITNSSRAWHPLRSQHAEPAKDIPPDMVVVVSSGAKLFHVPGCEFIHDKASERTLTAREAMQEGYVPCPRCLRQYLKTGLTRESDDNDHAEVEEGREEILSVAGH
ncbi:MAG: anti-sigma factor family protein [Candidatus Sulfotelmatobacter sp.]